MALRGASVRRGAQQTVQVATLPAPTKGINATDPLISLAVDEAIYSYNIIASERGMATRKGFRELVNGIVGSGGVRTLIPFSGLAADGSEDKLFAATVDGIYDATLSTDTPTRVYEFGTKTGKAGYGNFVHYVNDNGDYSLLYADGENGYLEYDPVLETWGAVAGITGISAGDISFISAFKERIWFGITGDPDGYYLDLAAKTGAVTKFSFGNKFKYGGELVGLYNWTLDGGGGIDDYLVALSRSGDVLVYKGYDPANIYTWEMVGIWYLGKIPEGRRVVAEFGGELYILSNYGINSMSALLRGANREQATMLSRPVQRILKDFLANHSSNEGWEFTFFSGEGVLVVTLPDLGSDAPLQLVMNIATGAWSWWRGVPIKTAVPWREGIYFGTADGRVYVMAGSVDGVPLDPEEGAGLPIDFALLTSFQDFGAPGIFKITQFIRPMFLVGTAPAYEVKTLAEFISRELLNTGESSASSSATWDVSLWDAVIWGGGLSSFENVRGALPDEMGRNLGIAMRGSTSSELLLVGFDVMWTSGGML